MGSASSQQGRLHRSTVASHVLALQKGRTWYSERMMSPMTVVAATELSKWRPAVPFGGLSTTLKMSLSS